MKMTYGSIFEDVGISQQQISLLENPLFLFPFASMLYVWYSYYSPSSSQFVTYYLIN